MTNRSLASVVTNSYHGIKRALLRFPLICRLAPSPPKSGILKVYNLESVEENPSGVHAVFIHYHPAGFFAPGFLRLIESACDCGYRVIVATNVGLKSARKHLPTDKLCVIHRANYGYDFGALRDVRLVLLPLEQPDESRFVIINSSMLNLASNGFGCDPVLDELAAPKDKVDLLGVTSSYESGVYHIHTYFYSLSPALFTASEFAFFLDGYWHGCFASATSPRDYAINKGEKSFTSLVLKLGLKVDSLFEDLHLATPDSFQIMNGLARELDGVLGDGLPYFSLWMPNDRHMRLVDLFLSEWLPKPGLQHNPVQSQWALLLSRGFYFVKRELLESRFTESHSLSISSMLLPVLAALSVSVPPYSDLHFLGRLVHSSKPQQALRSSR